MTRIGLFIGVFSLIVLLGSPVKALADEWFDSGDYNSYYDSGDYNSYFDSGDYSSYYDSGDYNSYFDSGDYNSYYDSGDYSSYYDSGDYNSYFDSGDYNSYYDSGDYASYYDSGDYNSYFDSGDYNSYYDSGDYAAYYSDSDYDDNYYSDLGYNDYEPCTDCFGDDYEDEYYDDYEPCTNCGGQSYYGNSYSTPRFVQDVTYGSSGCRTNCDRVIDRGCTGSSCHITQNDINLSATCDASPSRVKIGESVTWRANASGGNGNITYTWSGDASGSGRTVSKSYNSVGTKTATVTVRSGNKSISRTCSVIVESEPVRDFDLVCIANPSRVEKNENVRFTATATGGNGSYTYSWNGTDGISGSGRTISKSFSSTGTKTATVTATSNGKTKTATCNVVVEDNNENFRGSCEVSPSNPEKGETVTWKANASGGNGNFTYRWSGDVTGNSKTETEKYNSRGIKTGTVRITSDGKTIERTCSILIEDDREDGDLGGYCEATPRNADEGDTITWKVTGTGGDGKYTYRWSEDVSGNSRTETEKYNTSGLKTGKVRITSDGESVTRTCTVRIGDDNNSNITLLETPPNGNLASGVFLSQIPYTGVAENIKTTLFVLGLGLWSAFMAYIVMKKRALKNGNSKSAMIEAFKRENLLRKGIQA